MSGSKHYAKRGQTDVSIPRKCGFVLCGTLLCSPPPVGPQVLFIVVLALMTIRASDNGKTI